MTKGMKEKDIYRFFFLAILAVISDFPKTYWFVTRQVWTYQINYFSVLGSADIINALNLLQAYRNKHFLYL